MAAAQKDYLTVSKESEIEILIQKSRFIGHCFPVKTQESAEEILAKVRKKYYDATHNCFAYVIGENRDIARYSDDGEPSGTAGQPMLEVLHAKNLCNVLVIATRYFGGTLLGAGGLIRAYRKTTVEAVQVAGTSMIRACALLELDMDYSLWGSMQNFLLKQDIRQRDLQFTDRVCLTLLVPEPNQETFCSAVVEQFDAKIQPKLLAHQHYFWTIEQE